MLAEIQGKISRSGSNLTERLEDNLTGNVLGALRYTPFSLILGEVLTQGVYPKSVAEVFSIIEEGFWANHIDFWPFDREGELDAIIEFKDFLIGIEVKYKSGLSSEDEVTNQLEEIEKKQNKKEEMHHSINQLARESRILSRKDKEKRKLLLFIADRKSCKEVYENVLGKDILEKNVALGYISWQDLLLQFKKLYLEDPYHQVIVQDIIALLTRKGFEDFTSMSIVTPDPINEQEYFTFYLENKATFSFQTKLLIKEGSHYEFD
jgi:hypothetical protein